VMGTRAPKLTLAAMLVVSFGCRAAEAPKPVTKEFAFGARRVQVIVPPGWEALDQGQVKRFRQGEFEIELQLLSPSMAPGPGNFDELVEWGLAKLDAGVGHDQGREVKSRRPVTVDGREAIDVETWSRLDHGNPQRFFLVNDDGDLLALRTVRMAFADTLTAFDAIRDSLHLLSARR
jgi:hypothetical protein